MRFPNGTQPPSRENKKQVIAFLRPNQIDAVYEKASRENKTNQELIGEALNAVFALHGMPPLIKSGHRRIVRRSRGKARVREEGRGPGCRAGKQSLGGWFDMDIVDRLNTFSREMHISIQGIVEQGVEMITGVAPEEEMDWLSALPPDSDGKDAGQPREHATA